MDDLTFFSMYNVMQSGMWLLNDLESYLRKYDFSQARLVILLNLKESADGSINPAEIARITGKSRPAVSRMIEKLIADGLIISAINRMDGRSKKLKITEQGQEFLDKIIPEYNKRILAMAERLNTEEKKNLIRLLCKINFLDESKILRTNL